MAFQLDACTTKITLERDYDNPKSLQNIYIKVTHRRRTDLPTLLQKPLLRSKSAVKQAFYATIKEAAKEIWTSSPQYARMKHTTSSKAPSQEYCKLLKKLPRKHGSLLTQLRTGHIPLAVHLHRIAKAESPICPCCHQEPETVHHYLMQCPAHRNARNTLRAAFAPQLLSVDKMISERKTLPAVFAYIAASGRFRSVFGDLTLPPWEDDDF